jgi:hypothetical protein
VASVIDRAVTLATRHFFLFAATIFVFGLLPIGIVEFAMLHAMRLDLGAFIAAARHGAPLKPPLTSISTGESLAFDGAALCAGIVNAVGFNAVAANVRELLEGRKASFTRAIGAALVRFPQTLGVTLAGMFAFALGGGVFVITAVGMGFGIAAAYHDVSHALIALLITIALFVGAAMLAALALAWVAVTFAQFSTVVERKGVASALSCGFARVFARGAWLRTLGVVVVAMLFACAVEFAGEVAGVAAFLAGSVPALLTIFACGIVTANVIMVVLFAVYYCDLAKDEVPPAQPA